MSTMTINPTITVEDQHGEALHSAGGLPGDARAELDAWYDLNRVPLTDADWEAMELRRPNHHRPSIT